jgi:hypothetical protein
MFNYAPKRIATFIAIAASAILFDHTQSAQACGGGESYVLPAPRLTQLDADAITAAVKSSIGVLAHAVTLDAPQGVANPESIANRYAQVVAHGFTFDSDGKPQHVAVPVSLLQNTNGVWQVNATPYPQRPMGCCSVHLPTSVDLIEEATYAQVGALGQLTRVSVRPITAPVPTTASATLDYFAQTSGGSARKMRKVYQLALREGAWVVVGSTEARPVA